MEGSAPREIDLSELQATVEKVQDMAKSVKMEGEAVKAEGGRLEQLKATVDENLKRFKGRVKLNVGGSKFETTLSTLSRFPDSMLGAMFSGRHTVETDECGYTFIDRDGTHFRTILNYLRTDVLEMPASGQAAEELQRELEYYMLPSAPAALKSTRKLAIVIDRYQYQIGSHLKINDDKPLVRLPEEWGELDFLRHDGDAWSEKDILGVFIDYHERRCTPSSMSTQASGSCTSTSRAQG